MTATPPFPQPPSDDDVRMQQFLELAAPLFLDHRGLDESTWAELRRLARQTGLAAEELQHVVNSLQSRGVIREVEQQPVDNTGTIPEPPPPPPPVAVPPPPPRPAAIPNNRWAESDERKLFSTFLDRARAILAERKGLDATTYAILADIAHALGLTEFQFDEAIHILCGSQTPPAPPAASSRSPAASASPQRDPRPSETFRRYLKLAIQDKHRSKGYISEGVERRLVEEGVRKLGLSPVYSRQLVHEVAEQCGTTVISQQDAENVQKDPQFDLFLSRALPVVAQERGITARARVMLLAIAQECGLTEEAVDRAVELLQRSTHPGDTEYQRRSERREAFRDDLRRMLAATAGSMLGPPAVSDFVWRAEQLYGLDAASANDCLVEATQASNITMLTPEKAVQCITGLVHERLGGRTRLTAEDEWEILTYGEQLGIEQDELRSIVRDCIARGRRRRIRERNLTLAMLMLGGIAVVVLLGLFYGSLFKPDWRDWISARLPLTSIAERTTDPDDSSTAETELREGPDDIGPSSAAPVSESLGDPRAASEATADDLRTIFGSRDDAKERRTEAASAAADEPWIDGELSVLLVSARRDAPAARKSDMDQLEHGSAEERAAAYERLVAAAVDEPAPEYSPGVIGELLVHCVRKDPSNAAVRRLVQALVACLPTASSEPPENVDQYDRMFAALRILVAAAEYPGLGPERVSLIQERISATVGESLAVSAHRGEFEQRCFAAMLRTIYGNLVARVASLGPEKVVAHAKSLEPRTLEHLTQPERDRLSIELLSAGLAAAGDDWTVYRELLERTPAVDDPSAALGLLDSYESTTSNELKRLLAMVLEPYIGLEGDDTLPLDEVPDRVRASVGTSGPATRTREQSLLAFRADARNALAEAERATSDERTLISQTMRLARLATQGMALVRDDLETYRELSGEATERSRGSEYSRFAVDARPTTVNSFVSQIIERMRRTKNFQIRMQALDQLANLASTLPDIHPDAADFLASYYVSHRSENEHQQRMTRLVAFTKWNNLRIAIAHEVGRESKYSFQLEEVVNQMSTTPLDAPQDDQWPKVARAHLLREALQHVGSASSASTAASGDTADLASLQNVLQQLWTTQARLMGVDAKELKENASPAELLQAIAVAQSAGMKSSDGGKQQAILADLPYRLAAIEYVSSNDLERAVRLDRIRIELLATQFDAESKSTTAGVISSELQSSDADAKGLLQQLRSSQAALVRLCLLRLERTG